MFFRQRAVQRWPDEPLVDLTYRTVGRRLDLPLRMAASIDRTLAQFSTDDEAILSQAEAEAAVRLVGRALDLSTGAAPEDAVADALDRVEWTVPLVKVARLRRLWSEFWDTAVEEVREAQAAAVAAREADRAAAEARAEAEDEAAADRRRRKERLREEERRGRERDGGERAERRRPGPGAAGSVERAAFVFRVCGVPDADRLGAVDLRSAWIGLMKRHHPDNGGTGVDVQEVNAAYEVLRDGAR